MRRQPPHLLTNLLLACLLVAAGCGAASFSLGLWPQLGPPDNHHLGTVLASSDAAGGGAGDVAAAQAAPAQQRDSSSGGSSTACDWQSYLESPLADPRPGPAGSPAACRLPATLRYKAASGLCNQLYAHLAALAIAQHLGAQALVLPPARSRETFLRLHGWSLEPLESLLDTERMAAHWRSRGLRLEMVSSPAGGGLAGVVQVLPWLPMWRWQQRGRGQAAQARWPRFAEPALPHLRRAPPQGPMGQDAELRASASGCTVVDGLQLTNTRRTLDNITQHLIERAKAVLGPALRDGRQPPCVDIWLGETLKSVDGARWGRGGCGLRRNQCSSKCGGMLYGLAANARCTWQTKHCIPAHSVVREVRRCRWATESVRPCACPTGQCQA